MLHAALDFGNTKNKYALFKDSVLVEAGEALALEELVLKINQNCAAVIIGSSAKPEVADFFVNNLTVKTVVKNWKEKPLGIIFNPYDIHQLGADRIANVLQAKAECVEHACLVIDAGTCITYDALYQNQFMGMGISPGINLRIQAMHSSTAALPYFPITEDEYFSWHINFKPNTQDNMQRSVFYGVLAEIRDRWNQFSVQFLDPKLVITGGDALRLKKHLKMSTFADPFWTLKGYHEILLKFI